MRSTSTRNKGMLPASRRRERGFTLILRSEHAAYVAPSLDITDEVLRRLNQQLPTVSVGTDENSGLGPREN